MFTSLLGNLSSPTGSNHIGHCAEPHISLFGMAEDSAGAGAQPTPGKPETLVSIETDSKVRDEPVCLVTDEQWKAMFDVVMAIYDYREQEYVRLQCYGGLC
jgi:hypothetical protein